MTFECLRAQSDMDVPMEDFQYASDLFPFGQPSMVSAACGSFVDVDDLPVVEIIWWESWTYLIFSTELAGQQPRSPIDEMLIEPM